MEDLQQKYRILKYLNHHLIRQQLHPNLRNRNQRNYLQLPEIKDSKKKK